MAVMNLLKSSYTGKLGATTGAKWKNKNVVKAKIWAKAPPTTLQTQSVRAFEALNRISSNLASLGWRGLGLSDKTMLKHNAIAKWLKPCVANNTFNPEAISQVIPQDGDVFIASMRYNPTPQTAIIRVGLSDSYVPLQTSLLYILFFDNLGNVYFSRCDQPVSSNIAFYLPKSPQLSYYTLIFLSDHSDKGPKIHGFDIRNRWNMIYSLQEQDTGDIWLDGKPIYQKTIQTSISVPALSSQYANNTTVLDPSLNTAYVDTPISIDVIYFNSESQADQIRGAPNSLGVNCAVLAGGLTAVVRSYNAQVSGILLSIPCTITVKYTKK